MSLGKVYLISQPTVSRNREHQPKNMDALYEHGEVRVLVQAGEHATFQQERVMRLIRQRLEDFDPATDKIACVGGDPLAAVMVGMVLADFAAEEGFASVTWLRYDRPEDGRGGRTHVGAKYVPMEVAIHPESLEPDSAHSV